MAEKKKVTEIDILKMSDSDAVDALFGGVSPTVVPGGYFAYQRRKVVAKMRAALVEMQKLNPNIHCRIDVPAKPVKLPDGPDMPHPRE